MALATTAILSCTIDDYEEGEGEYSLLTADFVRAHTNGSTLVDYVITDDGDSLRLTQPYAAKWASTPDTVYRAALYHKPSATDSPFTTEAVSLGQVLTLMPHTKDFFKNQLRYELLEMRKPGGLMDRASVSENLRGAKVIPFDTLREDAALYEMPEVA